MKKTIFALWAMALTFAAHAAPITIGSLSSDDDGSTQVITDSLNGLEWLRWDQIANLNYADTVNYAAANGWSFAQNAEAQLFVDALMGPNTCTTTGVSNCVGDDFDNLVRLTGDNFLPGGQDYAWFLSTDNVAKEVGYILSSGAASVIKDNNWSSISQTDDYADGGIYAPISWLLYRDGDSVSVPEPGTLGLLSAGLIGLGVMRRKRQQG